MRGWLLKRWEDVLEIKSGRSQKNVSNPNGDYPIYGSGGTVMGYADDYICEEGTTIIGRKGTINNPIFLNTKFWNVDTAFGLVAGNNLNKRFLYYFCLSYDFTSRDKGTTLPSLIKKDLKKIQIPIPPIPEQKHIVAILDEAFETIDRAKANIEKNIQNAEELFQSKLNEVFSQRGEGWEEKRLGDICSVLNGHAFKSKEAISTSNTQLLRMGNLYQNKLNLERRPVFYPDSYAEGYHKYLLSEGDLIMSLTGTVDKTDYGYTVEIPALDLNLLLNQRIMKIIISNPKIISKGFLKNYLLSPYFLEKLYSTASGTRQANLSSKKIMKLPIYFPQDIQLQKKIVEEINAIKRGSNSLLTANKTKLMNLEELKKSILQKAFSGELTAGESGFEDDQDKAISIAAEDGEMYEAVSF